MVKSHKSVGFYFSFIDKTKGKALICRLLGKFE